MITINTINPALLVDQENARIPYTAATLQLNRVVMQRDTTPFSNIGSGKFRRLFNRHVPAFRR